jgi:SAM-dependent methyltransferase
MIPTGIKQRVARSGYYNKWLAGRLARSSKRLDLCAAQIALLLHLAGSPAVNGKVCLEVGSGWVLSHALIFHLLGAKKVIATDLRPLAEPSALAKAVHGALPSLVRDVLSPFGEHSEIRARLDNLLSLPSLDFNGLKGLGIEYIAPIDFSKTPPDVPADLIYSLSVLEYVPVEGIPPLLQNLTNSLRPGGIQIHSIHLEDHRDIQNNPFAFYSEPEMSFFRDKASQPVNRVRCSQWRQFFDGVKDLDYKLIFQWRRQDKDLPAIIDSSIRYTGEDDLRVSHIGVLGVKKKNR